MSESLLEKIVTFPYKKTMFHEATKDEVSGFPYSPYLLPILDAVPGLRLHRSAKLLERLVLFSSNCPINFRESLVDYAIEPLKDVRLLTWIKPEDIVDALKDASEGNKNKKKVFQDFIYDGNLYEIRVSPSFHGRGFGPELVILPKPWPEGNMKILFENLGKEVSISQTYKSPLIKGDLSYNPSVRVSGILVATPLNQSKGAFGVAFESGVPYYHSDDLDNPAGTSLYYRIIRPDKIVSISVSDDQVRISTSDEDLHKAGGYVEPEEDYYKKIIGEK